MERLPQITYTAAWKRIRHHSFCNFQLIIFSYDVHFYAHGCLYLTVKSVNKLLLKINEKNRNIISRKYVPGYQSVAITGVNKEKVESLICYFIMW